MIVTFAGVRPKILMEAHRQTVDEVLAALGTDGRSGLSRGEAAAAAHTIRQE